MEKLTVVIYIWTAPRRPERVRPRHSVGWPGLAQGDAVRPAEGRLRPVRQVPAERLRPVPGVPGPARVWGPGPGRPQKPGLRQEGVPKQVVMRVVGLEDGGGLHGGT